MKRLATRMALAMMAVAVFSLLVITISQTVIVAREFQRLPPEVRVRVQRLPPGRTRLDTNQDESGQVDATQSPSGRPAPAPGFGVVSLEELLARGFQNFREAQQRATLIGLAAAGVLAVVLALLLTRPIARPIERVSAAATRLAQGDLGARVPVEGSRETAVLAENFNAMAQSLERYEQERRAMIADIAHELRTPLAAMQLRLEALLDGLTPFDAAEAERLHRQTALLTRLVEDLRTLSLLDAGRLTLDRRNVDLTALAQQALDTYRTQAEKRALRLELDAGEPVRATVDPDRLLQVLGNLLDNAVRVSPDGGTVRLRVRQEGGSALIIVEDDGPGIAAEEIPQLFVRFTQNKDTGGKSGLGLAIVHALVQLHGGTVTAENRSEGGARFTVRLPPADA